MTVRDDVQIRSQRAEGHVHEETELLRPVPQKITITVRNDGSIDVKLAEVYRNDVQGNSDWVRWNNQADRGITIVFTNWPFVEPPENIQIEAGKMSEWFHIYLATGVAGYSYTVTPPLAVGPPGEPKIEVEG